MCEGRHCEITIETQQAHCFFLDSYACFFFLLKTTEKCFINAICHFTKAKLSLKLSSWNKYIRPVLLDIKLQKSQLLILASAKPIVQDIFTSLLCDLKLSQPTKTQLVGDDPSGFRHTPKCDQAPRSSALDQVWDQTKVSLYCVRGECCISSV